MFAAAGGVVVVVLFSDIKGGWWWFYFSGSRVGVGEDAGQNEVRKIGMAD